MQNNLKQKLWNEISSDIKSEINQLLYNEEFRRQHLEKLSEQVKSYCSHIQELVGIFK